MKAGYYIQHYRLDEAPRFLGKTAKAARKRLEKDGYSEYQIFDMCYEGEVFVVTGCVNDAKFWETRNDDEQ